MREDEDVEKNGNQMVTSDGIMKFACECETLNHCHIIANKTAHRIAAKYSTIVCSWELKMSMWGISLAPALCCP